LYFGECGVVIPLGGVVDPLQQGLDVDGAGTGLAGPQEGQRPATVINVPSRAANTLVLVLRNRIAVGIVGIGYRLVAVPFVPNHDFVGGAVEPDIISLIVVATARSARVETAGACVQGIHRLVDVLIIRVGVGFDAAAALGGKHAEVATGIGPDGLRAGTAAPNIIFDGVRATGPSGPLSAGFKSVGPSSQG